MGVHGLGMASSRFDDLLTATADLLDGAGTAAVTLRDVASAVGVSHNAPYRHFSSKQDILEALIEREIRAMCEVAEQMAQPPTVQALTLIFADWALAHPERFRLLVQQWPRSDREDLCETMLRWDGIYMRATERGQAEGLLPGGDSRRLSYLIRSTTLGAIQHFLEGNGDDALDPPEIIADLFRHLKRSARSAQPGEG